MSEIKYQEQDLAVLDELVTNNTILLVTATDLETRELHKQILPLEQFESIVRFHNGSFTYYLGTFGRYKVVHVQCSMGSLSRDSSIITVTEAIKTVSPKAVIMPGIAFGIDEIKQRIGDVLVAEAVQPYNNKRVGETQEIQRAYPTTSSKFLLNRVKNLKSWEFLFDDDVKAKMIPTLLLSGEELIDNEEYRKTLISKYPNAVGGEMEGAGVYAACDGTVDCILIKGICDFADGKKGKDKEKNQTLAMESVLSLIQDLFSSKTAFKDLGITPFELPQDLNVEHIQNINSILFELYDSEKEPYYVERNVDEDFNRIVDHYGIWVYGASGYGKSNLITRNLLRLEVEFIQINLAACYGVSVESFFSEILYDLSGKIDGVYSQVQPTSFSECVRLLLALLEKHFTGKKLILFIEEIPLEDNEQYKEFAQRIYAILAAKSLNSNLNNIKIVLSSINDPTQYIQSYNQKVHQYLKFLKLGLWEDPDIKRLIIDIKVKLGLTFSAEVEINILARSRKSPRFVKKFYRNLMTISKRDEASINKALIETERELNQMQNG